MNMAITSDDIKGLRDATGISVMQCKKALEEADGDMEKARIILQRRSSETAAKKADRELSAGAVGAYVHNTNEVAALVLLASETDFVAKNDEFVTLAREIAMHVAAQAPEFVSRDEVTDEAMARAKEVFQEEVADKPAEMQEQILAGKLNAYFKERILLEQPFIKNPDETIGAMIEAAIQKFGENISIAEMRRVSVK